MKSTLPEKTSLLEKLKKGNFNVPDFTYVPAADFKKENFSTLEAFFKRYTKSFKVIVRSAHPLENFFKGGTFDSLETYADLDGIKYARKRIINSAKTTKMLSILRQQKFNKAPEIDLDEMGIIVMPFIDGTNVMAKMIWDQWEFGYCHERTRKVRVEPILTKSPTTEKFYIF